MAVLEVVQSVAVLLAAAAAFGALARRIGQPAVIGQMFAGVALSPSLLGALPGDLTATLIPLDARDSVSLLAQLGLILFMFSLGADLDREELRRRPGAVPTVASATFAVPLLLGTLLALELQGSYMPPSTPVTAFVLFIVVALAITALPMLAAIAHERGLGDSAPAAIAMTSAALSDAAAWLLLSAALFASADGGAASWGRDLGLLALFSAAIVLIVRPALNAWRPASPAAGIAVATVLAIGAASAMTQLGLHAIIGAFFAGLVFPRTAALRAPVAALGRAGMFLLPLFLAASGLATDLGGLRGDDVATLLVVIVLALAGKLGAGWVAGRAAGFSGREAATIGTLLNTRGAAELVVLSIGLEAGILELRLYTVLVLMGLLTSAATGPLLTAIGRSTAPLPTGRPAAEAVVPVRSRPAGSRSGT